MTTPAQQRNLFDKGQQPETPPRWIGHRGPWGRNAWWTREDMPAIAVRHCMHPTALYPYYVTVGDSFEPRDPHPLRTLAEAQAAAVTLWQQLTANANP